MKSIYSLEVLQRIVDHWGIGKIADVTYFESIGRGIWRHCLETNQGKYELYSYSTEDREYAHQKILEFIESSYGHLLPEFYHSFERYHELCQLNRKIPIGLGQVAEDFRPLTGLALTKIFRVYGSIVQMYLSDRTVFCSYAHWSVRKREVAGDEVLVDTKSATREELDACLKMLESLGLAFQALVLTEKKCELHFSDYVISFESTQNFVALELRIAGRRNDINIKCAQEMWYLQELRQASI